MSLLDTSHSLQATIALVVQPLEDIGNASLADIAQESLAAMTRLPR